jgi:two-component system cell cycle sensor histidine kinase/response regulator CckA
MAANAASNLPARTHVILARIRDGQRVQHLETARIKKGGALIHVALTISPIREEDRIVGASHVAREITERRRLEVANAQLAAIVESSEDAIMSNDLSGIIQTWNSSAERIYGYTANEAIGQHMNLLLPADRMDEEEEILEKIRGGERVEYFETTRVRKGGATIEVALTISPIRDRAGNIVGASHVARDITERRRFEQQMRQAQRLESLGVLAGGIAHDFNNLLTGILGNSSLALQSLSTVHPVRSLIEDVMKASERAADLTRQLLAYAGKGQFVLDDVDLSALAREIIDLLSTSIAKGVELRLNLASNLPRIEADPTQIQQIMMNLVINGAEAIGNGVGTVTITTGECTFVDDVGWEGYMIGATRRGKYAYLKVEDNGSGMDDATRARIFDPFFTTKFTGRGLGLAAVLGIVRSHDGAIRVTSSPGAGSTFEVCLPAVDSMASISSRLPPPAAGHKSPGTVLVVDDEEIVRDTAKNVLERFGYTVVVAENGLTALQKFKLNAGKIDLVLLDLSMPVMNGEQALGLLQNIRRDVRVVLSSGYSEIEAAQRFAGKGLAGFLQKPYTATQLGEKVSQLARRV